MFSRRYRILTSCFGVVIFGYLLLRGLVSDGPGPLLVVFTLILVLQVYSLLDAIRNVPLPPLTIDLLRSRRRQAVVTAVVAVVLAAIFAVVAVGSEDPDRWRYLVLSLALAVVAVASGGGAVRVSQIIRRGEIPEKVRQRYETVVRRRRT